MVKFRRGRFPLLYALILFLIVGLLPLFDSPAEAARSIILEPAQREALEQVTQHFRSLRSLRGDFVQFGPDGARAEGVFYLMRPGKIRFHYHPPAHVDIIADGRSVSVLDKKLKTQDIWPLQRTPLRFLLQNTLNLRSDARLRGLRVESDLLTVDLEDKKSFGAGRLTLVFDRASSQLKQWTVTDAQGLETTVILYNLVQGESHDPSLFKIDYLAAHRQSRD